MGLELSTCKMGTILSCGYGQFLFFDVGNYLRFHEPIHMRNWQGTSWENATLLLQGTIEKGPKKQIPTVLT